MIPSPILMCLGHLAGIQVYAVLVMCKCAQDELPVRATSGVGMFLAKICKIARRGYRTHAQPGLTDGADTMALQHLC